MTNRRRVLRGVEDAIQDEVCGETAQRMRAEAAGAAGVSDLDDELLDRPVEAVIQMVRRDLGLPEMAGITRWQRADAGSGGGDGGRGGQGAGADACGRRRVGGRRGGAGAARDAGRGRRPGGRDGCRRARRRRVARSGGGGDGVWGKRARAKLGSAGARRVGGEAASSSPSAGECLKPWPEQQEAASTRPSSPRRSTMKPASGVTV